MKKIYVFGVVAVVGIVAFVLIQGNRDGATEPLEDIDDLIHNEEVDIQPTPTGIPPQSASGATFRNEEEVEIVGYGGHAMEPGISKDGNYLLFNDGPDGRGGKDLHWAVRLSDGRFRYMGSIDALNKSSVDATPAFDLAGTLYITTLFEYPKTTFTMYTTSFDQGEVGSVQRILGDVYIDDAKWFSIDPDPSPTGDWLYYSEAYFGAPGALPTIFNVRAARRVGNEYVLDKSITENINTDDLEYAPTISADGLELFFTRITMGEQRNITGNGIFVARRSTVHEPFGAPERIDAVKAPFVEAPSISLDGRELYYHKEVKGTFKLFRVTR